MIIFEKLRYKNILGTGNNFTEIDFLKTSTTIVIGESGSGKSLILDAISFVLFNRPFRNINKPDLVNAINNKNCLVEVEFSIGTKKYLVRRGLKPNVFEIFCNDVLIVEDSHIKDYQQHLEKNILKCNFKSFSQIVVLGAANFTPFMQLKAQDRRTIIEELLDIEIFSIMNLILKERVSIIKNEIQKTDHDFSLIQEKIELHKKYAQALNDDKQERINNNNDKIEENNQTIIELKNKISEDVEEIENLSKKMESEKSLQESLSKISDMKCKLKDKIKTIDKEIKFYESHDNCPTCHQQINDQFKNQQINEKRSVVDKSHKDIESIDVKMSEISDSIKRFESVKSQISVINLRILKNNATIDSLKLMNKKMLDEIKDLEVQKNTANEKDIEIFQDELTTIENKKKELLNSRELCDISGLLLKDGGVKAKIIKQYVPLINSYVNKFLSSMNFFINFNIDEEFNESIKSRGRDDFSYNTFSEGEKGRIDLALLFTWRAIAKMKNSINTNLLILDEVFDRYLDTGATENALQLLKTDLFKNTNIVVISHKENIVDKFERSIKFVKKNNFSIIE